MSRVSAPGPAPGPDAAPACVCAPVAALPRRRLLGWLAGGMTGGLAVTMVGCASLAPSELVISEADLLGALAPRFPARRSVAGVLDMTLARPRLRLLPADNRLAVALDLSLLDGLLRRPLDGSLSFSTGLRYDAARQAVLLAGVRTDHVAIDGAPQVLAPTIRQSGGWLVEQALEGAVVRQISPAELDRARRAGRQPGDIRITERGVVLALDPLGDGGTGGTGRTGSAGGSASSGAAHRAPVEERTPR